MPHVASNVNDSEALARLRAMIAWTVQECAEVQHALYNARVDQAAEELVDVVCCALTTLSLLGPVTVRSAIVQVGDKLRKRHPGRLIYQTDLIERDIDRWNKLFIQAMGISKRFMHKQDSDAAVMLAELAKRMTKKGRLSSQNETEHAEQIQVQQTFLRR